MKTKAEFPDSLEDLVFRDRNKDYGAYELRNSYPRTISKALFISTLIILLAAAVPLVANYYKKAKVIVEDRDVTANFTKVKLPADDFKPPPPLPPVNNDVKRLALAVPRIVEEDTATGDGLPTMDEANLQGNSPPAVTPLVIPDESENEKPEVIETVKKDSVYVWVEEFPSFPGGEEARKQFMGLHLSYPKEAIESHIEGTVVVTFVVEPDGSISNLRLLRDIGGGCGQEALRLFSIMPEWNPGRQNGRPVKVSLNLPVKFVLKDR